MADLVVNKVMRSIEAAEELYYRLVLVAGKSGTGKTSVMQKLADKHNTELININLCLSKELLELTEKQRQLKLTEILSGIFDCTNKVVFLDNIEVLFDVELKQDPLRLLQGLSRNLIVVASWNGSFDNGKLTYAEPGHREYRKYDSIDALVVGINEETTADFSQ
ncbi:MAG: BREX-3 system P-loop-containing protein BrxF [Bacteroidales bacterium]|nr:BREX-3 system P-loop-containing protein BrxF [Bacteroidales bacterium]